MADGEKRLLGTIRPKEDIGGPYPIFRRVELQLWSDGSVTWVSLQQADPTENWAYVITAKPDSAPKVD